VNRGRELKLICAGLSACLASPAIAKDNPPSLSIDPVVARGLLSPIDEAATPSSYRLDPGPEPSGGQRAKLTLDLGKASLFRDHRPHQARGRADRSAGSGPCPPAWQKRDSGKVYGRGVSSTFHGIDLSATYQTAR
jgi:hypothetical protein